MKHRIDSYGFGRISIDWKSFSNDVIITPEKIIPDWFRTRGHSLAVEDLAEILAAPPAALVVGLGAYSVMKPPESTIKQLEGKGMKLICLPTAGAMEEYNRRSAAGENVVAALHLTC